MFLSESNDEEFLQKYGSEAQHQIKRALNKKQQKDDFEERLNQLDNKKNKKDKHNDKNNSSDNHKDKKKQKENKKDIKKRKPTAKDLSTPHVKADFERSPKERKEKGQKKKIQKIVRFIQIQKKI